MPTRSFENLTVVSITGGESYIDGSVYAIQRSCEELPGAKGLLISPLSSKLDNLPANIAHRAVKPFGYMEYNLFVLYQLDDFIDTDYCLIVQNDGWVMSGKNWRDEFWDYDYIGAPIPYYGYYENGEYRQIRSEEPLAGLARMQNGGFSLRSKKMLGMPRKLGLRYVVDIPDRANNIQNVTKMSWQHHGHHEDNFITGMHRTLLEQNGIKIAPEEIAFLFSGEFFKLHIENAYPLNALFGIHLNGIGRLIGRNEVSVHLIEDKDRFKNDQEIIDFMVKCRVDVQLLIHFGYKLQVTC